MSDDARRVREALTDARALCLALGMTLAPRASARQAMVCCPWHVEQTPSCSVRVARGDGTLSVRCHACGQSGDALSLIAQVRSIDDFRELLKVAAELANAPGIIDDPTPAPKREERETIGDETYDRVWSFVLDACEPLRTVSPHVAAYLDARGIFADAEAAGVRGLPSDGTALVVSLLATFERADLVQAGVLADEHDALDWRPWALLIPWRDRFGRLVCIQRRRLDDRKPKYLSPRGRSPRAPFGVELLGAALEYLGPAAEVVIVEGAIDALARRRIARHRRERAAVLGVYSASSPCAGLPLDLLAGRRVVLALDVDGRGEDACTKLAADLHGVARELVRERPVGAADAKDWNAALASGGE